MNSQNYVNEALELARLARTVCPPNPAVGCVLVGTNGQVLGRGHTQAVGGPHAEVVALRDAAVQGALVRGATAYVTLEPCAHHGRTGPCCDALIDAGISKVVASMADPNPLVGGRGFARLRAAGIDVEVGSGAREAFELNIGFFSRMVRKTPWVRVKMAASLDGRTALPNGTSQWITGEAARADGHLWRAQACAVLTGVGTVVQDDPLLNVRGQADTRQPTLVVVDSRLETPVGARLFSVKQRQVIFYAAVDNPARAAALRDCGATVVVVGPDPAGPPGKVDLRAMLADLARREINEVHVEAGHKLNGSLIQAGLVDEWLLYLAPLLIGPGADLASLAPLTSLDQGLRLEFTSTTRVGPDLRIIARPRGRDHFLSLS